MAPRQGPDQAQRRRTANGISKKWKIARQSKHPRGLVNVGNNCYRHGALQPLLHLPRFVNWIKKHNRGKHWPCHANDTNRVLPSASNPSTLKVLQAKIWEAKKRKGLNQRAEEDHSYRGCVPCLLKTLMTAYWNNTNIGGEPDFVPQPFPHNHKAIFPLHKLAERWFCVNPPGHSETLANLPHGSTQRVKDKETCAARRSHMTDQQDSEEFAQYIFAGIRHSYDRSTVHGAARGAEYDSLFSVRTREVRTCNQCHSTRSDNIDETLGIRITPRTDIKNDTVDDALARYFDGSIDLPCSDCSDETDVNQTTRKTILAAPEYLRIHLDLVHQVEEEARDKDSEAQVDEKTGEPIMVQRVFKNTNPIPIPDIVDLTAHMVIPETVENPYSVRYRLVSATYHEGAGFNAGHYTAGVTGPTLPGRRTHPQFFCNDASITILPPTTAHPNAITENPKEGDFNATTLYYERIARTSDPVGSTKKRKTAKKLTKE